MASKRRFRRFLDDYRHGTIPDPSEPDEQDSPDDPVRPTPRKSRREYFTSYLTWLKPHRVPIVGLFLLAVLGAVLQMLEPLFMRFMIDRVLLQDDLDRNVRLSRLHWAGASFVGLIIVSNLIAVARDYRQRLLNVRVMLSLRRSLFERLLSLPLPALWGMKTGGILSRLSGDVDTTTGLLQLAIVSPALSLIRLVIAVAVLMTLNWRLALTALAILPGIAAISLIFSRRIRPIYRSVRKDVEQVDGRVGETFSGIRVVRAFRGEVRELFDYLVGRHTVIRKELFAVRREMVIWTTWGLLIGSVNIVILWYGGSLTLDGRASVGDLMAFQWYTFLLLNPVWQIVNSFSDLQRSLAATERVFEVLLMAPDKPDRPDAATAPTQVNEIAFDDVSFEYREGQPVVKNFSVTVPGGSVLALVGRSGAGKTTVTDLLARFHDPTSGRISLNGIDIRDYTLDSYRDRLALVQQDVFLFDGTVRDNIAYGRHDASDTEVEDAARRANAHEFIAKLPEGYGTFVGERGVKLSGGQCQRLAIARALLANPQILILDEATSNLDTESEQLIQASLGTLLAGRTTFVIAHRLSTIQRADLILLLDQGAVIERGTHQQLIEARGVYYQMVERQKAREAAESWDLRS